MRDSETSLQPKAGPILKREGWIRIERGHPTAVDALDLLRKLRDERPEMMDQLSSREDEEAESFVIESGDVDLLQKIEDFLNELQRRRENPAARELDEPKPSLPEL